MLRTWITFLNNHHVFDLLALPAIVGALFLLDSIRENFRCKRMSQFAQSQGYGYIRRAKRNELSLYQNLSPHRLDVVTFVSNIISGSRNGIEFVYFEEIAKPWIAFKQTKSRFFGASIVRFDLAHVDSFDSRVAARYRLAVKQAAGRAYFYREDTPSPKQLPDFLDVALSAFCESTGGKQMSLQGQA